MLLLNQAPAEAGELGPISTLCSLPTTYSHKKNDRQRGALCRSDDAWVYLRWFLHVRCLGAFRSLDNFELYRISFLQGAVAIPHNSGIMNKYIWTIVSPYEAIPFRVIKPFHGSLHLCAPPEWRPGCFSWRTNLGPKQSRH
jgi:hypothetical protein